MSGELWQAAVLGILCVIIVAQNVLKLDRGMTLDRRFASTVTVIMSGTCRLFYDGTVATVT